MRVLVVFAHPVETSFVAALHGRVVETLRSRGHDVDDLDLYAEGFDPVMTRRTFINYLDTTANRAQARPYVERLLAAEALVLVAPVWHDGFPAVMKGFFDCVFLPGVVFRIRRKRRLSADFVERQAAHRGLRVWGEPATHFASGQSDAPLRQAQSGRPDRPRLALRSHRPLRDGRRDAGATSAVP